MTTILQAAALLLLISTANAERYELDNGMYYDEHTGQVESNKYENENLNAPWNNQLKQDDISAPWNNPLRQDDVMAPWNNPTAGPQQTNRYMHDVGVTNPAYYQGGY